MSLEWTILISSWILTTLVLFVFIPRHKVRITLLASLFKQFITWILGLLTVELNLLSYPVRMFADVNRSSFTFEYYVYPAICGLFIVYYPEHRSKLYKFMYYALYSTLMTCIEVIIEKYTDLLVYVHWTWYWTWLSLFITFWMTYKFMKWYYYKLLNDRSLFSE